MILETGEGTGNGAARRGSRFTQGRIQGRKPKEEGRKEGVKPHPEFYVQYTMSRQDLKKGGEKRLGKWAKREKFGKNMTHFPYFRLIYNPIE